MTKIDIISGFLGAGKTTFIKKLLEEAISGEQVVLIENEFGQIGIDGGFLKDAGIEIREMNSGCICCSLVGDFGKSLEEVLTKYKPDRVIIEPSGVGKLSDVMKAVRDVAATVDVELNSAVTVVDASKCRMYMKNFGEFFNNQVENAGTVVLSRMDMVDAGKAQKAVDLLREHNQSASIVTTPISQLTGEQLLAIIEKPDTMAEDLMREVEERRRHHHHGERCCHEGHGHGHHHGEAGEGCCHEGHGHHHGESGEGRCCEEHGHGHHHGESGEGCCREGHGHGHHHGETGEGCCCEEHGHGHHHEESDGSCCKGHGRHDHEESDEACCCEGHGHENGHSHSEGCGHDHHDHHHGGDGEGCCHGHEHEHHHDHDGQCGCGCHDHDHHHADEVFSSWGMENVGRCERKKLEEILDELANGNAYGDILRAKGMVPGEDPEEWYYFDLVPDEFEIRSGKPDYTGKVCVIGARLREEELNKAFGRS